MLRKDLENILMQENVVASINNNFDTLLNMIPEIKSMVGFEHNHPHHHLDVWQHTLLALSKAPFSFEIRLVLLLHDIGKPYSYQDEKIRHFKNHPEVSSNIAYTILNRLYFTNDEVKEICYLIKKHDSLISDDDINKDIELAHKRFQIQFCDALAHHPMKLEKRINYLLNINDKINQGREKQKYDLLLNKLLKKKL